MKDDTALVSIVIPAYQAEKVLNRCIASILAQTYSNFECILIDDGSTDETPAICKQFAAQDHRIRFLQQKNSGPSVARNNGIRQAQGKYLLFVDADDWIEPQTCAVLIDLAEQKQADCIFFRQSGAEREDAPGFSAGLTEEKLKILAGDTRCFTEFGYTLDAPWGKLYRTAIVRDHCIFFPEDLKRSEDSIFSLRYFEYVRNTIQCEETLYHYEIANDSITQKYSDLNVRMLPLVLRASDEYVVQFHANDRRFHAACNDRVFTGMSEAESGYFFHPNNKKGIMEKYKEYKSLLMEPSVRLHILDMKQNEMTTRSHQVKRLLYRYPTFLSFLAYYMLRAARA